MEPLIPADMLAAFILLTFALLALIAFGYNRAIRNSGMEKADRKSKTRRLLIPLLFWLLFLAKISDMDFFHDWSTMPPRLVIAVLPPLIFAIALFNSKRISSWLEHVPQHWLILVQSFRIVMELILWRLFIENVIPVQMTFEGRNLDILSGLTALVVGYLAYRKKFSNRFIIGWNIFGLVLLANIVVVALLSTPIPFRQFMNEPANTIVAYFPFVWLPCCVVPLVLLSHLASIRQLLYSNRQ